MLSLLSSVACVRFFLQASHVNIIKYIYIYEIRTFIEYGYFSALFLKCIYVESF